ncbi:P27 family phage terminase small subunit [Mesorhizobium sp. IMUNJ 23232]|uniref:P27 family phage terminase small subunit n=1 Tax=Mesorhizobium sp. IMUNJ 23232 TaxID=3376064 RepID=UPI0037A817E8
MSDDLGEIGKAKLAEVKKSWGRDCEGSETDALIDYCRLFERKAKADDKLREHGELVAGPNGFPVESPWLAVSMKCGTEMRRIAKELGG